MNKHTPSAQLLPDPLDLVTTDTLPRHRFSWDEVLAMVEAGILPEDARVELIAGELIEMSPKGARHEIVKDHLNRHWFKAAPEAWWVACDTPLKLTDHYTPEPDVMVRRAGTRLPDIAPQDLAVVVEIANSSLSYDLTTKAHLYAAFGVPEYWVIDTKTGVTHIHANPTSDGYAQIAQHIAAETLSPQKVPELSLRIADVDLVFADGA